MPQFSAKSLSQLATCHADLQTLFNEVVKYIDCTVTEGYRNEEAQNKAFAEGKSKLKWPNGNHNKNPSIAADVYPYPIDMNDTRRFYYFAGFVKGIATKLIAEGKITHDIRWGGDWDSDNDFKDNTFNDFPHFELVP
jgi:peptidoglycan L-alanyl-D-glutamate endopeptidase CwlK